MTVEMKATDQKGKPVEAELSLGAVDESVYAFGEDRIAGLSGLFSNPHPPRRFYRKAWRVSRGFRKELLEKNIAMDQQDQGKVLLVSSWPDNWAIFMWIQGRCIAL